MPYKNGRDVKNGDKVVLIDPNGTCVVGIVYDYDNGNIGKIAQFRLNDATLNMLDALHLDDIQTAVAASPVCQKKAQTKSPA